MKRYRKATMVIISLCLVIIIAAAATIPGFTHYEFMIALKLFLSALLKVS